MGRRRTREEARQKRSQEIIELRAELAGLVGVADHRTISDLAQKIAERHYKNHEYEVAAEWARAALQHDPFNTPARCYLVGSLEELGRHAEAVQVYQATRGDRTDWECVRGWLQD